MDEDISAINTNSRNANVINFFIKNKKIIIIILSIIILSIFSYFIFDEIKTRNKIKIADNYNTLKINFDSGKNKNLEKEMINIIYKKDETYSPLALYFLIENNIINSTEKINNLFDVIINDLNLDREIKNLVIYKKALYNSDFASENDLLNILNPIINSDSIWKSHSLYLLGEYFLAKKENEKAKEFFEKILVIENSNPKIKLETQKRIQRDFSE
tara:strand:+ start:1531 stop:2175 length:645 start_codon:yes stop_codon:yes gene_type:complete